MTRSEFTRALVDEFGDAQSRALMRDLVLDSLGTTGQEALNTGVTPKTVWMALCDAMDVPVGRRHGVGLAVPPTQSSSQ